TNSDPVGSTNTKARGISTYLLKSHHACEGFFGVGSNIGHCLFVGWVEHFDIYSWVSFLYPTYSSAIFTPPAKPNKMAEDRIIPDFSNKIFSTPRHEV
ncbi:MAG: hypothetical protein V2J65_35310, partial [Desulfobacteraceae bacterium]|nr:hypothetical protein [Desulfobacteraceae bacterium]